jgi:hypothetical protein
VSRALDILATLRLEDGREWGDAATRVQLDDARAVLAGEPPYNYLTRARGYSKTADLAGCVVAMLLTLPAGSRCYWLAADQDQGKLALDSIAGYVQRTEILQGSIEIQASRVVAPTTDNRLDVLAADAPSSWGLRPAFVAVDEFAQWPMTTNAQRLWEAVSSAATKVPGCRMAVITTAGSPHHPAAEVLDHARGSELWRVSETAGPPPWMNPERLVEQRARLPEGIYAQLFENVWTEAEGAFLSPAALDECFALAGPQPPDPHKNPTYVAGLDLGHVNDRTALAVAHRDGPNVILDYMSTWAGSRRQPVNFDDVENAIVSLHDDYRMSLHADPWQGLHLLQHLRDRGVRAKEFQFTPSSKQRLASTLLQSVNDRQLKLYPVDGLREELLGLRVKQTSTGWTFDHDARGHDDRATALALAIVAAWATSGHTGPRRNFRFVSTDRAPDPDRPRHFPHQPGRGDYGVERQHREEMLELDVRQERRRRRREQREADERMQAHMDRVYEELRRESDAKWEAEHGDE